MAPPSSNFSRLNWQNIMKNQYVGVGMGQNPGTVP